MRSLIQDSTARVSTTTGLSEPTPGVNLLKPGNNPKTNLRFLTFFVNTLAALEYACGHRCVHPLRQLQETTTDWEGQRGAPCDRQCLHRFAIVRVARRAGNQHQGGQVDSGRQDRTQVGNWSESLRFCWTTPIATGPLTVCLYGQQI